MIYYGVWPLLLLNLSLKVRLGHKYWDGNRLYFGHNSQNVEVIVDKVSKFQDDRIFFIEKVGTESMKNLWRR